MQRRVSSKILPRHSQDPSPATDFEHTQDGKGQAKVKAKSDTAMDAKNHFLAAFAEFIGTFLFLFFAFGGTSVANAESDQSPSDTIDTSKILFISLSFGFSLVVNAWAFYRVSGGLFNPAVNLALAIVGGITWARAAILTVVQVLGSMCAAAVVDALLPGPLNVRTTLNPQISVVRGLFLEMFLTVVLVLTILLLAVEKHKSTFIAPVAIGLALFIAELTGVYWTGGSLNPARSFGPEVVNKQFAGSHWIYWLGPAMGACIAAAIYKFLVYMDYETVNPDQDAADETNTDHPGEDIRMNERNDPRASAYTSNSTQGLRS